MRSEGFLGGAAAKNLMASTGDEVTWVLPLGWEDSKHDQRMISHMISAIKSRDHYMIVM